MAALPTSQPVSMAGTGKVDGNADSIDPVTKKVGSAPDAGIAEPVRSWLETVHPVRRMTARRTGLHGPHAVEDAGPAMPPLRRSVSRHAQGVALSRIAARGVSR